MDAPIDYGELELTKNVDQLWYILIGAARFLNWSHFDAISLREDLKWMNFNDKQVRGMSKGLLDEL